MAIVVETGAGLSDANSFVSVADADAYHALYGNAAWTGDDALKEGALIRASAYLTRSFDWQGTKINFRAQSLAWPRSGVVDGDGYTVPSDAVPIEIINATCELALRELEAPGAMNPDVVLADKVKREKIDVIEIEYLNASMDANASRPIVSIVNDMIGPLLSRSGATTSIVGRAVRS